MIFDCFLFFNELDVLKIRLEELRDVVDRFVLVEASRTFSGARKPLYFQRYRDIFSEYTDRITHHVVPDMPRFIGTSRWRREHHQRDAIGLALAQADCKSRDIVLVSDVDEIPRSSKILEAVALLESHDLVVFEQVVHQYYVDNILDHRILGTVACRYDFLRTFGSVQRLRFGDNEASRRAGIALSKPNIERKYPHLANGGWHLSFFGGPDAVLYKQQSYAHCERDPSANRRLPYVRFNVGLSKFVKNHRPSTEPGSTVGKNSAVDCRLPRYLLENPELFTHFFEPVNDRDADDSTKWYSEDYNARRRFYSRIELQIDGIARLLRSRFPHGRATLRRLANHLSIRSGRSCD
jgi:beta-1,4-mannosyl-glycoprotein beta-1,4-N-acetylglucosaminyltransferase